MTPISPPPRLEAGERHRRRRAVQALGAGEVEKGLVDRQRLDRRRQRQHQLADLAPDACVFRHIGRDDHGLGAGLQRLEHRHRRMDAVGARDIAGGGDDAAAAAADDDRPVGERRIVALFDRRVEGVAVDMRDGEREKLGLRDDARAAAIRAALLSPRLRMQSNRGRA